MIGQATNWWLERSVRERWMLATMIAVIALTFLWFAVIVPVRNGLESASARHTRAVNEVAAVQIKAQSLERLTANPAVPLGAPLATFVTLSSAEAGFTLTRSDPVGTDGVMIAIPVAKTPSFLSWINALGTQGVFIDQLTIRANSDTTIAVEATLKVRSL